MSIDVFGFLGSFIFPKYCCLCNVPGSYICDRCKKYKLKVNFRDICHVCGNFTFTDKLHKECEDYTNLDYLYFFCEYNHYAKKMIEIIKYQGYFAVIDDVANIMCEYIKNREFDYKVYTITGVPSHWKKRNLRGFNQSELLAEKIAKTLCIDYIPLLQKTTHTNKQAGKRKSDRSTNLRKTFERKEGSVNVSRNVMIIDDVHTTGSTLNECSAVLKSIGVETVVGYTFAKSLRYSVNEQESLIL